MLIACCLRDLAVIPFPLSDLANILEGRDPFVKIGSKKGNVEYGQSHADGVVVVAR